ncbi:hypothetical protein RI367_001789 [Sorochytrium milnesiophthora]
MLRALLSVPFNVFFNVLFAVRQLIYLYWLSLQRYLTNPRRAKNDLEYRIVFAGDDNAFGYGDWSLIGRNPGIGKRLTQHLYRLRTVRHVWLCVNEGVYRTTSRDWLPPASSKAKDKGELFTKTFERNESVKAADVVVLMLGANDWKHGVAPQETLGNLKDISAELAQRYRRVYVCTVPNWLMNELNPNQVADSRERNKLIASWLQSLPADGKIRLGVALDDTNFEFKLKKYYSGDREHFGALASAFISLRVISAQSDRLLLLLLLQGFDKIAKDLALQIEKDCRRIEFEDEARQAGLTR